MELHGKHLIGFEATAQGDKTFQATNPSTGELLPTKFQVATQTEIDKALELATEAYAVYKNKTGPEIAAFLNEIASEIEALGDTLLNTTHSETGLPLGRLQGERGRTITQLKIYADLVTEGSWVDARIDQANPDRKPAPKPDVRSMNRPVGPVVVFGASNFPLAISVCGNDTVAALAVGCPVVVKAHRSHPGTSELVGRAIVKAAEKCNMPKGVFALLHGNSHAVGQALTKHPLTKAVAFTGSLGGGRALFDAAASRKDPIPVYAEMSSLNPVILLPGALKERGEGIAKAFLGSVTLGVGQFCTKPGLVFGMKSAELSGFEKAAGLAAEEFAPQTMLNPPMLKSYNEGLDSFGKTPGVTAVGASKTNADVKKSQAKASVFTADAKTYNEHHRLQEENFGPSALIIACTDRAELMKQVNDLEGHLAASVHGTEADLKEYADVISVLETKVGRIVINGFTTGIDLCHAIVHGGPYPATTYASYTSMGQAAFRRFVRPVCFQDFPQYALPKAIQNENSLGLWRLIDGKVTQDSI